jgi:SAM-dependent methyltransferase
MDDVRKQLADHLVGIGYRFDAAPEEISEALRQRMGERRFAEYRAIGSRRSPQSQEEVYKLIQDIFEGSLMRSFDRAVTLDASVELYQRCLPFLRAGTRVLELGCWTGGLASFIAARHPECGVVGVDAAQKVIDACNAHFKLPNLSFAKWNYRWGKPDDLESADVLLCSFGVVHQAHVEDSQLPEPTALRANKEYRGQRDYAVGYFAHWRTAAKSQARLFAILRLIVLPRFLAWIDAAQATGWRPALREFWRAELPGRGAVLPGLVFDAAVDGEVSEDELLDCWNRLTRPGEVFALVDGGPALAVVRALGGSRRVLASRQFRPGPGGPMTLEEVGIAGAMGYGFVLDGTLNCRLVLVPHAKAEELAAGLATKGLKFLHPLAPAAAPSAPAPRRPTGREHSPPSSFPLGRSPFAR